MTTWRRRTARVLCALLEALQPLRSKNWARAISAEVDLIEDDHEAFGVAFGAAIGLIPTMLSALLFPSLRRLSVAVKGEGGVNPLSDNCHANPTCIAILCGIISVLLGLGYLWAAGATLHALIVNFVAMLLGIACLAMVKLTQSFWQHSVMATAVLAALLIITTLTGITVEGATRWVYVGPFSLQPSLILLPAMLLAFGRTVTPLTTVCVISATIAVASQPDRAMAAVALAGLLAIGLTQPNRFTLLALSAAAVALAYTSIVPENLPAVAHVDGVLFSALAVHPLAAIAVWLGSLLLIVPALVGEVSHRSAQPSHLAFGAIWAVTVLAAALGNYPTPVVGYGASAIIGYFLSIAALPREQALDLPVKVTTAEGKDDRGSTGTWMLAA
ncbi:MAG: hypothetical protein HC774_00300 [Sphingomonadales bacterium]|nr:hypothetical protein [Sphingomonadales bacterium]